MNPILLNKLSETSEASFIKIGPLVSEETSSETDSGQQTDGGQSSIIKAHPELKRNKTHDQQE